MTFILATLSIKKIIFIHVYIFRLKIFFIPQVPVNFEISLFSKLYTNLVFNLYKCVNLVINSYKILLSLFEILNTFYYNI